MRFLRNLRLFFFPFRLFRAPTLWLNRSGTVACATISFAHGTKTLTFLGCDIGLPIMLSEDDLRDEPAWLDLNGH